MATSSKPVAQSGASRNNASSIPAVSSINSAYGRASRLK